MDERVAGGVERERASTDQAVHAKGARAGRAVIAAYKVVHGGVGLIEVPVGNEPRRRSECARGNKVACAWRSSGLEARAPARDFAARRDRIHFRERRPRAIGTDRPVELGSIAEPVHEATIVVLQLNRFSRIGKPAREGTEHTRQSGRRLECRRVRCHHEVAPATNERAFGKREIDPVIEPPAGEVHVVGHLVVEFHPLHGRLVRRRVIHDLVKRDDRVRRGADRASK